jgi:predicted esterase
VLDAGTDRGAFGFIGFEEAECAERNARGQGRHGAIYFGVMRTLVFFIVSIGVGVAQQAPKTYTPTDVERRQIESKAAELAGLLKKVEGHALYADAAIYHKAADFILKQPDEFINAGFVKDTLAELDAGIARAKELAAGDAPWSKSKGRVVRAYRSTVDGSLQPYGVIIPESYSGQAIRLDVWLHGMNRNENEVSFIKKHQGTAVVPAEQSYIQLDVFGRNNVAYRWAGETDVFEALKSVRERYNIDPKRITLRGFSMGGAGVWHIGLQHPDQWTAFEAGAGFTETKVYAKKTDLPPYQEAALHYYDARDYALNGTDVPFVGYGGEIDPQLQASKNVKEALLKEGVNLESLRALFLVGPGTAHQWHPETHKVSDRFIDEAAAKGLTAPDHVRFVTYTTRFNQCFWITVDELEQHYRRAEVDGVRDGALTKVTTKNVARIVVEGTGGLSLDGQHFAATGTYAKTNGRWAVAGAREPLHKRHGLQGPVDDAFVDSFLCVRPTGQGTKATEYGLATLDRFRRDFAKWLRGEPRVKDDRDVTAADIAGHNLILFGDPWSNSVIAKVVGKLPVKWTKTEITLAGRTVDAANYAPVLVYPNPLNPNKYVVINSGHTFSDSDWRGTNANLYPHLGDYALVGLDGVVAQSGYFDERWK